MKVREVLSFSFKDKSLAIFQSLSEEMEGHLPYPRISAVQEINEVWQFIHS